MLQCDRVELHKNWSIVRRDFYWFFPSLFFIIVVIVIICNNAIFHLSFSPSRFLSHIFPLRVQNFTTSILKRERDTQCMCMADREMCMKRILRYERGMSSYVCNGIITNPEGYIHSILCNCAKCIFFVCWVRKREKNQWTSTNTVIYNIIHIIHPVAQCTFWNEKSGVVARENETVYVCKNCTWVVVDEKLGAACFSHAFVKIFLFIFLRYVFYRHLP